MVFHRVKLGLWVCAALLLAGCEQAGEPLSPATEGGVPEFGELAPGSNAAVQTTAPVREQIPTDEPPPNPNFFDNEIVGEQTSTRTSQGVSVRIQTSQLEPGHVHTAWAIFFDTNTLLPIFAPPPRRLDGTVVGGSGKATFAGSFNDLPVDPKTVGVHGIVRSHGPKTDAAVQMATAGGGCTTALDPPGSVPDAVGECANVQAAVDIP